MQSPSQEQCFVKISIRLIIEAKARIAVFWRTLVDSTSFAMP